MPRLLRIWATTMVSGNRVKWADRADPVIVAKAVEKSKPRWKPLAKQWRTSPPPVPRNPLRFGRPLIEAMYQAVKVATDKELEQARDHVRIRYAATLGKESFPCPALLLIQLFETSLDVERVRARIARALALSLR